MTTQLTASATSLRATSVMGTPVAVFLWALVVTPACGGPIAADSDSGRDDIAPSGGGEGHLNPADETDAAPLNDSGESSDASDGRANPAPQCPPGTTNASRTLGSNVTYPTAHLASNPVHSPFPAICLPITAVGQSFYLESKVIRAGCTAYDACEVSLEIKCFNTAGTELRPQVWSGENFLNGQPSSALFARLMFTSASAGPVTCKAMFFNHDHGIAGGSITIEAGSTFTASGPLNDAAATPDFGGGVHLSSAKPTANMKFLAGWHMPTGKNEVDYVGDIQVTECHVPYPQNANNPATECTASEPGPDSVVAYEAQAYEEYPNGTTCHVTNGLSTTTSVNTRTHHKMLYTQVVATHTPGCANVWHFDVSPRWIGGRSFMIQSGPYGQGMVRPL